MSKLSTSRRKHLPKNDFAEPGERKYPINDPSHARNALARVSQHGTPEEKRRVRAAVHRKYPKIGTAKHGNISKHHGPRKRHGKRVASKA